jgi:hypothetical protein
MIMNLWDLFVGTVFGGFWLSVLGLAVILLIILAMGGISGFSILTFLLFFLACMAFGYGYPIFEILIFGIALYYAVSQYMGWAERSGGN